MKTESSTGNEANAEYKFQNFSKNDHLKVPDNYFDSLPGLIADKRSMRTAQVDKRYFPRLAYAFGLLILLLVGFWFLNKNTTSQSSMAQTADESQLIDYSYADEYFMDESIALDHASDTLADATEVYEADNLDDLNTTEIAAYYNQCYGYEQLAFDD